MLATQTIDSDALWHEANNQNKAAKPRSITHSFDSEIAAQSRQGFEYNPFTFREQWRFLQSMFYKVPQGTQLQIKRRYEGGAPDDFIPAAEVHNTLLRLFGDELHPCIQKWAIHYIPTTAGARFNPAIDDPFFAIEGTQFRNAYTPSGIAPSQLATERPPQWQKYLDRLMPRDQLCTTSQGDTLLQQVFFEALIAQRIQHPEVPPLFCLLLRGEHGTGKGYWMDNILRPLIGETNFIAVTLADVQKGFIADIYNSTVVHIEEINDSRGKSGEKMKKLITENQTRVEAKYQQPYVANKYFNIVASSNVYDPIKIEQNDRRYFVPVYSKHLHNPDETKAFFSDLTTWLEEEGGLQVMANYLHSLSIENFNFRFPPHTQAKDEIMEVSTSSEDKVTTASMEINMSYKECVFSLHSVMSEWQMKQADAKQALLNAGFTKVKRQWGGINPTNMWVHKTLVPDNHNWREVSYTLFKRRDIGNPYHCGDGSSVGYGCGDIEVIIQ